MMKNPDWLNSSLWSSPQPPPSPPPTPHNVAAIAEPSVPIPPPAVERPSETLISSSFYAHATKGETRDPLLLGYLPADRSLWPFELAKKRSQYKNFKAEQLMNPVSS
ncbi:hypothetical protein DH2020_022189 [Rehmannia glutinosa]|uniref:Uncharacterized protein n=1 Tax=Rehmannia glutinosa TaxID=99300 RepID=A0ABR0WH23_REHGL